MYTDVVPQTYARMLQRKDTTTCALPRSSPSPSPVPRKPGRIPTGRPRTTRTSDGVVPLKEPQGLARRRRWWPSASRPLYGGSGTVRHRDPCDRDQPVSEHRSHRRGVPRRSGLLRATTAPACSPPSATMGATVEHAYLSPAPCAALQEGADGCPPTGRRWNGCGNCSRRASDRSWSCCRPAWAHRRLGCAYN